MIIVGIDPGKTGGIAIIRPSYTSQRDVDLLVMPEIQEFAAKMQWLETDTSADCHVFLEKAQSFPGQGIASAFNYGVGYGELLGVLWALGLAHTLVPPRTWTKAIHAGTKDAEPKKRTLEAVQRLFPEMKLTANDRCKKPHLGIVDALAIAEYGRRKLNGG